MKIARQERASIYQGKNELSARGPGVVLLFFSLLAAHFLNLILQWTVIRKELEQKPLYQTPEYSFLGFSLLNREKIAAVRRLPNASPAGRVFAYFDPLHPAVFMVWNNGKEEDFLDLGPLLLAVPAGFSRVTFYPGSVLLLLHGKKTVARNFGGSILGNVWARAVNENDPSGAKGGEILAGSFVVKPVQESHSQGVPYLIYFFLPLALIIILIATSGTAMAAAFFYYAGMFFLFDYQKLFVTVPLDRLFNVLGVELSDSWSKALAVALTLLFLAASIYGLWRWKNRDMAPNSKWIVWFFILLPLFLFF